MLSLINSHNSHKTTGSTETAWYWLGKSIVRVASRALLKMDVVRHAPLPDGPKIIAANHPSTTDPALVMTLAAEQTSILISETLFQVPVLGRYLDRAGHIPVVRSNGRAAFERAKKLLEAGHTIVIFPEGAISPLAGGYHPPHTGVARLALSTGAQVVPVGIHLRRENIQLIETEVDGKMEVGTWYLNGPYAMTVGAPMHFGGDVEDRPHVRAVSRQIMQRISQLAHQSELRLQNKRPVRLAGLLELGKLVGDS
jgi:1-acyl-sn-glycerol-3-phosphate acyltransferase